MDKSKVTEVYEDNAGGLNLYHMVDGETVYSAHFWGQEWEAAQEFAGLTMQDIDPVTDGWESAGLDPDEEMGQLIATSDWYEGDDADMWSEPDGLGAAGRAFVRALESDGEEG